MPTSGKSSSPRTGVASAASATRLSTLPATLIISLFTRKHRRSLWWSVKNVARTANDQFRRKRRRGMACADVGRLSAALIASSPRKRRFSHRHAIRRLPLGDIAGRSLHYIVHGKGERWVELTLHQSGGLQGRRDDRAGCNARRCAGRRCGNLRNRETCGLEGRRDHDVRVERVTRLPFFTLIKRSFGRTVRAFGGCASRDKGVAVSWNLNRC